VILAVKEAAGENIFYGYGQTTLEEFARSRANNRRCGATIFNPSGATVFFCYF
jgi:hypothetical protein